MSDIHVQYVRADTASAGSSVVTTAANFSTVVPANTLLLPATSMHWTAGGSRISGSATEQWRSTMMSADLATDGSTITFARDNNVATANVVCGVVNVLEYVGPAGGPNEYIRRYKGTVTIANSATTADSGNITGVTDISRCVPVAFVRTDAGNNQGSSNAFTVDIVNVSGNNRVRLTRTGSSGNITAIVYVVEFTGTNFIGIQRVAHTFSAADTNEDETVSTADPAHSFVIRTFVTAANTPDCQTVFAYLSSSTNLRFRAEAISSTSVIAWVITNSQLVVQRIGTPDGTPEWVETGSASAQNESVSCTAVGDIDAACALIMAGSTSTDAGHNPGAQWRAQVLEAGNVVDCRRNPSRGSSEYVIHVLDATGVTAGPQIDSVTAIANGGTFTITGVRLDPGTDPTVSIGGVAQTVDSSSATSVACTFVRGLLKYGPQTLTLTTTLGVASFDLSISPQAGWDFVNVTSLAPVGQRMTTTAVDLAIGDQVAWGDVVGGDIEDAIVEPDVSINNDPAVTEFDTEANDGTGWTAGGLQEFEDPPLAPVFGDPIADYNLYLGLPTQVNFNYFATGHESAAVIGTVPGMVDTDGLFAGIPTTVGIYDITVRYTNTHGDTDSNEFQMSVAVPNQTRRRVRIVRLRRTA